MTDLSNSRINTAAECEYKYFRTYVLGQRPERQSSWFLLGKSVHEAIDAYYKAPEEDRLSQLLREFDLYWASAVGPDLLVQLHKYQTQLEKAIEQTKANVPPTIKNHAMTKYFKETWEPVLEALKTDINAKARLLPKILFRSDLTDTYDSAKKCLVNFHEMLSDGRIRNSESVRVVSEMEFKGAQAFDTGKTFRGFIDRLEEVGKTLRIYDYKTGKSPWDQDKVSNDDQLMHYAYTVSELFPDKVVERVGIIDLLRGQVIDVRVSKEQIERYRLRLAGKCRAIRALDELIASKADPENEVAFLVPAGRNHMTCSTCDFKSTCKYLSETKEETN